MQEIEDGRADPDEFELRQWRVAKCQAAAASGETSIAWITPMRTPSGEIEATALWVFSVQDASEDPPELWGVFDSFDEAVVELRTVGAVHD